MSLVFDMAAFSPGCGGKLWLGGEAAASNLQLLRKNKITYLAPAASKPCSAQSMDIKQLTVVDGTGIANNDIPFEKIMTVVDQIVEALVAGHSVLIYCRNGAHRSATLCSVVLLRMLSDARPNDIHVFLNSARNIVDLESRAPPTKYRQVSTRPIDALAGLSERVRAVALPAGFVPLDHPNELLTPIGFRRRCLELGFSPTKDDGKPLESGASSAGEGTTTSESKRRKKFLVAVGEDTSAVESFEMVSENNPDSDYHRSEDAYSYDGYGSSTSYVRLQNLDEMASDSDLFAFVNDELEDPATRREKIRMLMQELRNLDAKLMGNPVGSPDALGAGDGGTGSGQSSLEREEPKPEGEEEEEEVVEVEEEDRAQGGIVLCLTFFCDGILMAVCDPMTLWPYDLSFRL